MSTPVTRNVNGTSSGSFTVGLGGPTIHGGTAAPSIDLGKDGDLYVRAGAVNACYSKISGGWVVLVDATNSLVHQTTYRGVPIDVDTATNLVSIQRNPYTIDSLDVRIDSTAVKIDNDPSDYTEITMLHGVDGRSVVIKDAGSKANVYEIRVRDNLGQIDGSAYLSIAAPYGYVEVVNTGGAWRVIGRS